MVLPPKPQPMLFSEAKAPVRTVAAGAGSAVTTSALHGEQGESGGLHTFLFRRASADVLPHHGYLDLVSTL